MSERLAGQVIVVTGAQGALGRAVAAALIGEGAKLALLDRIEPADAAPESEYSLVLGGVDLGDPGAAAQAMARAVAKMGRLDALVNVAGGFAWEPAASGEIDTWDRMYHINLRTAVIATQAALPHILKQGRGSIVNVCAQAALQAGNGMAAYAASKSGVARLTEGLADELKDRGVRVNAVLPSIIDTPANRKDMPDADASRWVSPASLAAVICFLLSDDASAVTGALLPVRGRV